jgi:hypothetical protein
LLNLFLLTFLQAANNISLVGTQTADGGKVLAKVFANGSVERSSDGPLAVIGEFSKVQVTLEEDKLGVLGQVIKQFGSFFSEMTVGQSSAPELVRGDDPLPVLNKLLPARHLLG